MIYQQIQYFQSIMMNNLNNTSTTIFNNLNSLHTNSILSINNLNDKTNFTDSLVSYAWTLLSYNR